MAQANSVSVDNIRHRSARAVEYYKQRVLPIYQSKRDVSPSPRHRNHYGSEDNLNGVVGDGKGGGPDDRRVGFKDGGDGVVSHAGENWLVRGGHRATYHGTQSNNSSWKHGNGGGQGSSSRGSNSNNKPQPKQTPESSVVSSSVSGSASSNSKRLSRGLYRSNSNLEMDSIEYIDADDLHNRSMHRDYGSTSSLDIMGTSTSSDSFFAMLKDFKDVNLDQRSPAPAKLSELLKGGFDRKAVRHRHLEKVANGTIPTEKVLGEDEVDSPRTKSKFKHKDRKSRAKSITSETRPQGIFNKLRGKTDVESGSKTPENVDMDLRAEERLRCKSINHYDCQSLGFSIQDVVDQQHQALLAKNISTGASAASASRNSLATEKDAPDILVEDTDDGDNKSNGLVLSCPFFRNETGGEEERTISLGRTTVSKNPSLLNPSQSAIHNIQTRSPACCGLSILDSAPTPTGLILPHVVLHRGHVIEGDDRGATYYRHFFYGYGRYLHQKFL